MSDAGIQLTKMDSRGYVPEQALKGTRWEHCGNHHVYVIDGFSWNGEDDTWMIKHHREDVLGGIDYLRTPANFFGIKSDGTQRYVRAKE